MLPAPSFLMDPINDSDNCTIEFNRGTSVSTDINGFPIITSTPVQLRARIFNDGTNKKDIFPVGSDLGGELLSGRLHNPVSFPAGIKDLSMVRLIFDDGRSGPARIKIKTQNPHIGLIPSIGQRFYLLFRDES